MEVRTVKKMMIRAFFGGWLSCIAISTFATTFLPNAFGEWRLVAGQTMPAGSIAYACGRQFTSAGVAGVDRCPNNQAGQVLTASLAMQGDGNLVFRRFDPESTLYKVIFHTNTLGNPGAFAVMQTDGNFVVRASDGRPLWSAGTDGIGPNSHLAVQSDGQFVIYSQGPVWSSGTSHPSYVVSGLPATKINGLLTGDMFFSANQQFFLALQGDGNLVLYPNGGQALWATHSRGTRAIVQDDGNFVLYDSAGTPTWWSGTAGTAGAGSQYGLFLQDDGNLVLYGLLQRWVAEPKKSWYVRLCEQIRCRITYSTEY